MFKKFAFAFALAALSVASAETYKITLFQPSLVQGKELKPGSYRLNVTDSKVEIVQGKQSIQVQVKVESTGHKVKSTFVRYANADGRYSIQEIQLGGTDTKLVFNE